MESINYRLQLEVISEGYDRETEWFQPRAGVIPPATAVLTMTKARLWGSDIFTAIQELRSDDFGRTWSAPTAHATLDRRAFPDGVEACPCDMTPAWHTATRTLLLTGHTANYYPGAKGGLVENDEHPIEVAYAVYRNERRAWTEWATLDLPDRERFHHASAGCTQRVDLPNGEILLPLYCLPRGSSHDGDWIVTVIRCSFDGVMLRYLAHGDELHIAGGRGFCEPSLAYFGGRFFLTLRNDDGAYVAASRDGLHYDAPTPWRFDTGEELGSYNTQQHWAVHSDGLFLVYTRRGADNDMVFRHRAPLFMAQVDPEQRCVLRATEREIVPNHGAQLGNFGVTTASPAETWVITSECMQGDAEDPLDLTRTERRGANNRVYLCRILWDRPNRDAG